MTQIKVAVKQAFDNIDAIIFEAALVLNAAETQVQTEGICQLMTHQKALRRPKEVSIIVDLEDEDLVSQVVKEVLC